MLKTSNEEVPKNNPKNIKNLDKLIQFNNSKPLEQELKISVINSMISPKKFKSKEINCSPKMNNLINKNMINQNKSILDSKKKPSHKFKVLYSDPFNSDKKNKSNFGYVYSAGGIPCRILHGSVKLKLKWDIEPSKLDFDPLLVVCFEGLMETEHPYNFASRQSIRELLLSEGAYDKVITILSKLINPLRTGISSSNLSIFEDSLEVLEMVRVAINKVSILIKGKLNIYLHFFLQQINKNSNNIKFKERCFEVLRVLETNGGEEALKEIKKKIPTYSFSQNWNYIS